jgi:capsular polysaccharide biosynthesis protein
MNSDKVYIRDLIKIIVKYKFSIIVIIAMTVGFSIQLTNIIEKKFKASFEINVYSKYFKNPLISEIIPGVYNIPEMRFTIDSMVKEAINDDFIDEVGNEYGIYKEVKTEKESAMQRQFLRDRFSYYSTGGQSYKVTFTYSDPVVAKEVAEKTLDVVRSNFIDSRIATIELVKSIMVKRLNAFNASQKMNAKGTDKVLASKSFDVLIAEQAQINSDIAALSKHFQKGHPKLIKLKSRKRTIKGWLKEFKGVDGRSTDHFDSSIAMSSNKTISENLTSSFYTKYHDFNIALDIEKKSLATYIGLLQSPQLPTFPTWPKKRLFASIGLILGFVFAFIIVFLREVMAPNTQERRIIEADDFSTVILGVLPGVKLSFNEPKLRDLTRQISEMPRPVEKEEGYHISNNAVQ